MQLLPLLGRPLKDDEVIELLEQFKADVVYDFDRLHEGQADVYWAALHKAGIQFRFDEAQVLETMFLYIQPGEGFAAFRPEEYDVPAFATAAAGQAFGEGARLQIARGKSDLLGVSSDWIKLQFGGYSVHYEFREGSLALVTVSRDRG